jgi:hypothetical protein
MYQKLPSDSEKANLLLTEQTNVNFIPVYSDGRNSSKGRCCLRFYAVSVMLLFVLYAVRLINLSCKSTVVTITDSSSYHFVTFSDILGTADSFEISPADVNSILLDVKGEIVSKINTRITSQSDNILFAYKAISQNPDAKVNVTVKHKVEDGMLRIDVESLSCNGADKDKPGHKPPGHKKPDDDDKPGHKKPGHKKPDDDDKPGHKKPDDDDKPGDGSKGPIHKKPDGDGEPKHGCKHSDTTEYAEEGRRGDCKDIIIEMTIYLPQSKTKEGTNLKVNAVKSTFATEGLTGLSLGAFEIRLNSGVISSKGVQAKTFVLYVESGGINGIYREYTSFSAQIENGGMSLENLKSNQNTPSNVHLGAKTGSILVSKIEFSQNYVNVVDASVKNGAVKVFARDNFSGDFTVQTEVGSYKVTADTSGLGIDNNIRSPTGGYVSGTFRSKDILQNGRINIQATRGSSELKFTSNN